MPRLTFSDHALACGALLIVVPYASCSHADLRKYPSRQTRAIPTLKGVYERVLRMEAHLAAVTGFVTSDSSGDQLYADEAGSTSGIGSHLTPVAEGPWAAPNGGQDAGKEAENAALLLTTLDDFVLPGRRIQSNEALVPSPVFPGSGSATVIPAFGDIVCRNEEAMATWQLVTLRQLSTELPNAGLVRQYVDTIEDTLGWGVLPIYRPQMMAELDVYQAMLSAYGPVQYDAAWMSLIFMVRTGIWTPHRYPLTSRD